MLLEGRVGENNVGGPKPLSLGLSVLVHACVLALLAGSRPIHLPKPKSAYEQLIQGHEQKLVWYHLKKLPEVKSTRARKDDRPLRAESKNRQQIVSAPRKAPKAPQMIWQPAPEINTDIKFDSANVVAVSLPKVEPPKQFVPPVPALRKKELPGIDSAAPPDLQAGPAKPVEIAGLRSTELSRPRRGFERPVVRPKAGPPKISDIEPAPSLADGGAGAKGPAFGQLVETELPKVYRPFEAPRAASKPGGGGKAGVSVPVLPSPPVTDASADAPGELNAVVVGLNPGNQLPALPPISRPADFSAGPKLNPKGGAGGGDSAALSVPDLTIRGDKRIDTRATLMAKGTVPKPINPSSANSQAEVLRDAAKYITVDQIGHPSALRVSNAPDARFDGRIVYMMAIQMPNITSFSGSWLMWYSERTDRPVSTAVVTPPGVHRKVDPKYIAAAVSERVEGTVRLTAVIRKDGSVGSVELVRGLDARLDRTAQEALSKWLFSPAMRNGEPIDVDILVEIPFHLRPLLDR
jgi:TonB family protein